MSKHTSGPWIERDEMLVSESGIIVCDPYGPNPQDARLIAAAPDLLAALETLLDNGDDPHPLSGRDPTVRREDIGPARAAIAKARGEER